jgi:hypothetical protein
LKEVKEDNQFKENQVVPLTVDEKINGSKATEISEKRLRKNRWIESDEVVINKCLKSNGEKGNVDSNGLEHAR